MENSKTTESKYMQRKINDVENKKISSRSGCMILKKRGHTDGQSRHSKKMV